MIFMKFFARSSRATGPKMRVPFGLSSSSMMTIGVAVEAQVAAVGAAERGLRANDDGLGDLTLLHGGVGAALLDVDGDDITDVGSSGMDAGLAAIIDGAARTGVVGDVENGTHLDHGGISWCGLGLGGERPSWWPWWSWSERSRRHPSRKSRWRRPATASTTRIDAPALEAADRAGLHDLDLVADLGLVLLVVDVKDGLAIDDLVVKRVRRLVGDGDLDGLVARAELTKPIWVLRR